MPSEDPVASISKGITKGVIEYTKDEIKRFISRFKNRELAFIEDVEVIDIVKQQRATSEWDFFKKYMGDPDFRIIFQMGLTLRRFDRTNEKKRLKDLRDTI